MLVNNNKTQEKTNVVIKLYHTNQSIHLQGGKRMGKVTSTSLMGDHLEEIWKRNMVENVNSIKDVNDQLKVMVVKPGMVTRAHTGSGDLILYCDKCSYSGALKHHLNMHKMSNHSNNVKPIKIAAHNRKFSPNKSLPRTALKTKK